MANTLHPYEDPRRRCLPVAFWPEQDRLAWEAAMAPGDVLDGTVGAGFHWRSETREKYRKGYGRWLTFLIGIGKLWPDQLPADRVTVENVQTYIAELQSQDVGSWTLWGRLAELLACIKAIEPGADFTWLRKVVRVYEGRTVDRRNKLARLQPAHEVLDWAMRSLPEINRDRFQRDWAGTYRDALAVAVLACCPIRLSNLTCIEIGAHLKRNSTGYMLRFIGAETKTGRPIDVPVHALLTAPLEHYLAEVRPYLLQGRTSSRLWVTRYGDPMNAKAMHLAITRTTERAFGRSINPHLFRDCAATFVALEDPEHIGIVSPLLGHVDPRTAEAHYIQANQIVAGRRIRLSVAALRRTLSVPKREALR